MAEPASGSSNQTFLSATPYKLTDEYQNQFRQENRQQHFATFYGVVPCREDLVLTTYLGDFIGSRHLYAVLTSYTRMDLTMPAPDPGSALGRLRSATGLFNRGMLLDQLKGLAAPPADLLLNMTIVHPAGKWEGLYYSNMLLELDCGAGPLPMSLTITLRNNNPVQEGVFAFNVAFPRATA